MIGIDMLVENMLMITLHHLKLDLALYNQFNLIQRTIQTYRRKTKINYMKIMINGKKHMKH